jgi:hypothetical protein
MAYAIKTLSTIPFGHLIGAPMKAAIEAQALAAKTTVDFIQTVGFEQKEDDPFNMDDNVNSDVGKVRNVVFKYNMNDEKGDNALASLTVPILTIIPIPFIRIDEMTIDFMAKINEMHKSSNKARSDRESNFKYGNKFKFGWGGWGASGSFSASHSSKHSSTSSSDSKFQTEFTMNINVRAVQDDMPAGLSRILNILESAIIDDRKHTELDEKKATDKSTTPAK